MTADPALLARAAHEPWRFLERCWQSPVDATQRYGFRGDLFYKIALRELTGAERRHDLPRELEVLERARGIPGIPEVVDCSSCLAGRSWSPRGFAAGRSRSSISAGAACSG